MAGELDNIQNYATADDIAPEKSTIAKSDDVFVTNISDPNALHQFASYNSLFTLSALSQADLENVTTLLNSKPHDIIVKSSGIGPSEDVNVVDEVSLAGGVSADIQKALDKNERVRGAVAKSRRTLAKNRDLYIRNVIMNGVPGLNEKRRLTSVTQMTMEIVEPAGITLLERVRGAAVNNGFLDHLDAPYLLTVEFKGFDELGKPATAKDSQNMKRLIPIKLIEMNMSVDQAGTVYTVKAIPYNEFAYVNRYNYPRTAGNLAAFGRKLSDVFVSLELLLNKQNQDEVDQGLAEKPDIYTITFDEKEIEDVSIQLENMEQQGMSTPVVGVVDTGDEPFNYMQIRSNNPITKILEEIMKGHPAYSEDKFKEWNTKVRNTLSKAEFKGGAQAVIDKAQGFYFPYFKIRASVTPIEGSFDNIRATNQKKINFHVEPYNVHAYSLAIPGVSTGDNFKNFVFKTYNYIFTGENLDVLDLNIDYKVAYFQGKLKDFEATNLRRNRIEDASDKPTGGTSAVHHFGDQDFLTRSEVTVAKSEGTGKTGGTPSQLDAFLDALTHPLADMANIRMEILGDPAWISQSQFIPLNSKNFKAGTGKGYDPDINYWRAAANRIWNADLRCYNTDIAEPIVLLNFRMPTDINDQTGLYELQSTQSAAFSGLYRVIQIDHNFQDGKFTNTLHLTRFNNQGVRISTPISSFSVTASDGKSYTVLKNELTKFYSVNKLINVKSNIVSLQKKFNDYAQANINRVKGIVKDKIQGFFS